MSYTQSPYNRSNNAWYLSDCEITIPFKSMVGRYFYTSNYIGVYTGNERGSFSSSTVHAAKEGAAGYKGFNWEYKTGSDSFYNSSGGNAQIVGVAELGSYSTGTAKEYFNYRFQDVGGGGGSDLVYSSGSINQQTWKVIVTWKDRDWETNSATPTI